MTVRRRLCCALLAKEGVGGYSFTTQADLPVIKNY